MTILHAMQDPALFGPWFAGPSWVVWRAFVAVLLALPLSPEELAIFQKHTGRLTPLGVAALVCWVAAGRRGGKSILAAFLAVYHAAFKDYSDVLSPGERGVVMILASDRQQARVVFGYVKAFMHQIPTLAKLIERETAEAIHLTNGISIEVHTSSFRAVRGYTIVCAILDEVAFWRSDESANPDQEIVAALKPAMATVPGALLLGISSPYARRGVLWEAYRDHYGKDGDPVLFWQAPSLDMNPSIPESVINAAYAADPIAAAAEYGAEFRSDVAGFVTREVVEACVFPDRHELAPLTEHRYHAFVDPSGGSADSMTLAIAHRECDTVVIDAIRERTPPFSPDDVVKEFVTLLKSYNVLRVSGDRYAGEWPRERFRAAGMTYDPGVKPKRELYQALLPVLNAARIELLDIPKLAAQLVGLERRTARGGRDSIDHAPRAHDDVANALAGVVAEVLSGRVKGDFGISFGHEIGEPSGVMSERNPADAPELQRQRDRELIARHEH